MDLKPYIPPPSHDVNTVFALLQVMADPAAGKQLLEKIAAEKQAADAATDNAAKMIAEVKLRGSEADAALAAARKITDDFNTGHAVRTKQLRDHEGVLSARQKQLYEFEAQVSAREKEISKSLGERDNALLAREASIAQREAELQAREAAAASTLDTANNLKVAYEQKLAAAKSFVMAAEHGVLGASMGGVQ